MTIDIQAQHVSPGTEVVPGPEAVANARRNPNRQWNIGAKSAVRQFATGDFIRVNHRPKFTLDRDAPVFTIGSCFARNLENVLSANQVPLTLEGHGVVAERYESWNPETGMGGGRKAGEISRGAFHKYTTPSMLFDIQRALTDVSYPDEGLLELEPGQWFDPHAAGLAMADRETALDSRRRLDAGSATVREAGVVIITLGLTEGWREKRNGLVMNRAPRGASLVKKADLFEFVNFGYEDVHASLVQLVDLISEKVKPLPRIIVTVSPVPSSTFRARDVIETLTASKSMLRTAAEMVMRTRDHVDYFPSYEMVMQSPRALAWKEDGVHVQPEMVRSVMDVFMNAYYG